MTGSFVELTEDQFDDRFPLKPNHLNPSAGWATDGSAGCLFETYGEEYDFVISQDPRAVWTLVDGDDGELYIVSGLHFDNRIGYLVSIVPVSTDTTTRVHISMENRDDDYVPVSGPI